MRKLSFALAALAMTFASHSASAQDEKKPTIVLVHGAFADSSSWNQVIDALIADGYPVLAAANPLRGVISDAANISAIIDTLPDNIVLVGHSYGGPVITEAANGKKNIIALVYVAAFIPETGESSLTLSAKFPGSTLGETLTAINLPNGEQDLYISPDLFPAQFAADVPAKIAAEMAASQRPVALSALNEPSGQPGWKSLPTYVIYGTADRNVPAAVMKFMAERAKARKTVVVDGASHALMVSHAEEVTALIEAAARAE